MPDLRINLTKEEAERVLERLPGTPALYKRLADVFINYQPEQDRGGQDG